MRKDIITNAVIFVIGLAVGAVVDEMILKKKYQKKADDEINKVLESMNKIQQQKKTPEIGVYHAPEVSKEEVQEAVKENNYISDDEPETAGDLYNLQVEKESEEINAIMSAFKKKHKGKIEAITRDDWDTDFPETDYDKAELYYFPEEDILADEDSNTLEESVYVGALLDKYGFKNNPDPDEKVYVRNNILEKEFIVNKVLDATKEEYLGPEPD